MDLLHRLIANCHDEAGLAALRAAGLAPLAFHSLAKLPPVASALGAQLAAEHQRSARLNLSALADLHTLVPAFAAAGIPLLLLKGAALATRLYPAPSLRPMRDLDLLVHPHNANRAHTLLTTLGYTAAPERRPGAQLAFGSERSYRRPGHLAVELHWHLLNLTSYQRLRPTPWFWQQTETITIAGAPALVLRPTAQLLHLAAHLTLHHFDARGIWTYDIALLLARWPIDAALLRDAAARFALGPALLAADDATRAHWNTGLAPALRHEIAAASNWSARWRWALAAERWRALRPLWNIAAQPSLGQRLAAAHAALLPSAEYLRAWHGNATHLDRWLTKTRRLLLS
ncbi:MAG: nucleotidyltransferase family protein [Acidobacteriaceae bacterium]|nr:nucleotidyltransferase family protein [Acidobacteriaceae bacterium]